MRPGVLARLARLVVTASALLLIAGPALAVLVAGEGDASAQLWKPRSKQRKGKKQPPPRATEQADARTGTAGKVRKSGTTRPVRGGKVTATREPAAAKSKAAKKKAHAAAVKKAKTKKAATRKRAAAKKKAGAKRAVADDDDDDSFIIYEEEDGDLER
ncbi:MAG: hypothetical protein H6708_03180 [Kofleriaceae bacterium]|nr:hypothetical protein [Myxococcales bacterium]MCB9559395.1 hypothetical protein [Kofleriaceae bacterium]